MKLLIQAAVIVSVSLFVSCQADIQVSVGDDRFEGDYEMEINCSGELERDNGDEYDVEISNVNTTDYLIEIDDEYILTAFQELNGLTIPEQELEELFDQDEVFAEGSVDELVSGDLEMRLSIDSEEGISECRIILFLE